MFQKHFFFRKYKQPLSNTVYLCNCNLTLNWKINIHLHIELYIGLTAIFATYTPGWWYKISGK